ncbi:hypothetical protein MO973_08965 [Paenibacillus sp. TRM 82003]|nr:hypothetical protein [Paenibacillus sp. TRM 82003]
MNNMEIKRIGAKSAFKATIYFAIIPMAFLLILGLLIAIIGASLGSTNLLIAGIPYIVMPFVLIFIYGLLAMLASFVYNKLAGKYGGLKLQVELENGDDPAR